MPLCVAWITICENMSITVLSSYNSQGISGAIKIDICLPSSSDWDYCLHSSYQRTKQACSLSASSNSGGHSGYGKRENKSALHRFWPGRYSTVKLCNNLDWGGIVTSVSGLTRICSVSVVSDCEEHMLYQIKKCKIDNSRLQLPLLENLNL